MFRFSFIMIDKKKYKNNSFFASVIVVVTRVLVNVDSLILQMDVIYIIQHLNTLVQHRRNVTLTIH
jgi:hypothetical protein